ncbi:MAG: type II toxin-antitoxin system VapC family toxin [Polyangia bacterium]
MKPIVAVDTDVLILLLSGDRELSDRDRQRRSFSEQHLERLQKEHVGFAVPSPVLAELTAKRPGRAVLQAIAGLMGATRIVPLNADGAIVAGDIISRVLSGRPAGADRVRVKFDQLVAAVAHHVGARYLLTANAADMQTALRAISSGVVVLDASQAPVGETMRLPGVLP